MTETQRAGGAERGMRLTLGESSIDVFADDPTALQWLAEFLDPAFTATPIGPSGGLDGPAGFRVRCERSNAERARLEDSLSGAPPREMEVFTLDGSFSRHAAWSDSDGWRWAYDDPQRTFYGINAAGDSVRIVTRGERPIRRLALMRVIRELATTVLLDSGQLPVHGASFLYDGAAVLICGPKQSGKTTLLIHALRCGATFLSNDRLFVDLQTPLVVHAMPTIVMLRDGTLEFFANLKKDLEEAGFDRGRTLAECAAGNLTADPVAGPPRRRRGISPAQFCRLAGVGACGNAPVGMVLFPRVDPNADGVVLERLTPGAAEERMDRSLLKPSDPCRPSPFFSPAAGGGEIPANVEARRCRTLVERVPAYDCRLGPNAFHTDLAPLLALRDR